MSRPLFNRRQHIRFKPDPGAVALIDPGPVTGSFRGQHAGLIINESYNGVALVLLTGISLRVGDSCRVRVGPLAPVLARVVWKTEVDSDVVKMGLTFPKTP